MNKLVVISFAIAFLSPSLAFASDDWSWGMSNQSTHLDTRSHGQGKMFGSGMTGSWMLGSGTMIERDTKGLVIALSKLNQADRDALMKIIRDYLTSKGVSLDEYASKVEDRQDNRKDRRDEIKDKRKTTLDAIKQKREAMKGKLQSSKKQKEDDDNDD